MGKEITYKMSDYGYEQAQMKQEKIQKDNDTMRRLLPATLMGNRFVVTESVLSSDNLSDIIQAVRNFNSFTPDNDPHGEHDFGSFKLTGIKYFWKIDYYDKNLEYGVDPYEEEARRILTIMEASEY